MKYSFLKSSKILLAVLIIASFFSFSSVASAAQADDTQDIVRCTTAALAKIKAIAVAEKIITKGQEVAGKFEAAGTSAVAGAVTSVPVFDPIVAGINGTVLGVKRADKEFRDVTKLTFDAAVYALAQCTLTQLTNNTVKWIQGGFGGGGPKFAVNRDSLFKGIATGVLEDFSYEIKRLQACDFSPNFIDDLGNAVQTSDKIKEKFPREIKCPFPAMNITASQFNADFNRGGWKAMEMALSDRGNRFGVSTITAREAARRAEEAKKEEDQKLSWSNGFADLIDTEHCNYPSNMVLDAGDPAYNIPPTIKFIMPDGTPDGDVEVATPERFAYYQKKFCPTTTPGKIIGDSLMKAVGAEQDRLGLADSMDKIISALLGQLTKQVTKGIFKAINDDRSPGGTALPQTSADYPTSAEETLSFSVGIETKTATAPSATGATLHGSIDYIGQTGTVWFEIGTTADLAVYDQIGAQLRLASDSTEFEWTTVTPLASSTTYFFRAVGQLGSSTSDHKYGEILTFDTL